MNIQDAISEPFARLIDFHDMFNRNLKISFGALEMLSNKALADGPDCKIAIPTGTEPWGNETLWKNLEDPIKNAGSFLAEIGLLRASSAFEDYLIISKAEFDRSGLTEVWQKKDGVAAMFGFDAILGIERASIVDLEHMVSFFEVARNCIVHRSNRASSQLVTLSANPQLLETLERWSKRGGKWRLSLPSIREDCLVEWRPRHAIMASDVYYRCAKFLDGVLVGMMGEIGLARMAAHWCFFADPPVSCPAKINPEAMVRTQLEGRYWVRSTTIRETVSLLRKSGQWKKIREIFARRYPNGPETGPAIRRRIRQGRSHRVAMKVV